MQSSACVATGELYAGLVEVGVGLIPAGGGCKELLYRYLGSIPEGVDYDPNPFVQKAFERIGMAKVATSGEQARAMGFLRPHDPLCMDPDAQVQQAKRQVLGMVQAGYTPAARGKIKLPGPSGRSAIELFLMQMGQGGFATPHDLTVGKRLAYILTGGDVPSGTWVDEQHLLDPSRRPSLR